MNKTILNISKIRGITYIQSQIPSMSKSYSMKIMDNLPLYLSDHAPVAMKLFEATSDTYL